MITKQLRCSETKFVPFNSRQNFQVDESSFVVVRETNVMLVNTSYR